MAAAFHAASYQTIAQPTSQRKLLSAVSSSIAVLSRPAQRSGAPAPRDRLSAPTAASTLRLGSAAALKEDYSILSRWPHRKEGSLSSCRLQPACGNKTAGQLQYW
eukprot:6173240-Pleurochrysis_carterae.AAC.10